MGSENCYRPESSCYYSSSYCEWPHWVKHSSRNYSTDQNRWAGRVEDADVQDRLLECAAAQVGTLVLSCAKIHDHRQTLAWSRNRVPS